MPIYEYEAAEPGRGCKTCSRRFEVLQRIGESTLAGCPACGGPVRKLVSRCRAAVVERVDEDVRVESQVKEYEREGMWSHAAELADKHSEKTGDTALKQRAYDDYQKAGYQVDKLIPSSDE
jgi:putative FmdB family regulatory protein